MERLTYHKPGGGINIRGIDALNPHEINGAIYLCICRLFDYENTGLTPQEVLDILNPCDEEPAPECVHIGSEFAGYNVFALSGTRCVAERIDKLGFDDYVVWLIDDYGDGVCDGIYFQDRQTAFAHFVDNLDTQTERDNNPILSFYNECCIDRPGGRIYDNWTVRKVYEVFREWCKDNNHGYAPTITKFNRELVEMFGVENTAQIQIKTNSMRYYTFTLTAEAIDKYRR